MPDALNDKAPYMSSVASRFLVNLPIECLGKAGSCDGGHLLELVGYRKVLIQPPNLIPRPLRFPLANPKLRERPSV